MIDFFPVCVVSVAIIMSSDFFDFMSNKDSDTIVSDLKKLHDTLDGVGNLRDGVEIQVIKGDEGNPSTVVVNETK